MFPFLDPQISSQAAGSQDPIHVGELLLLGAVWKIQVSHIDMAGFGKQPTIYLAKCQLKCHRETCGYPFG